MPSSSCNTKADSYFEPHADDEPMSDEPVEDAFEPEARGYFAWLEQNWDALSELWRGFRRDGETMFGRAFFQFGTFENFTTTIYRFTQP
jgi:hypothetical protein